MAGVVKSTHPGLANCLPPLHVCGDFASQRGVAGRSRMPSARAERGRSGFPPSGLRAPSPGVRPGSVFMRVKFARREVPGRICGGGCSCDLEPGPIPPRRGGGGQHRTGSCNGGWWVVHLKGSASRVWEGGGWTGFGRPPKPEGSLPILSVCFE